MEDAQATDGGLDGTDEFDDSVMAWEITAKGKSARDIGALHEAWAAAHVARGAVNKAQDHLDSALEIWSSYDDAALTARTWCLKASCSAEANDFAAAAGSFKRAQQFAEEASDFPLVLCVMVNRAICEIRRGDAKAAASRARRAFVKAEREGNYDWLMTTYCVRAASYQMVGNFLAACNEYEAAAKMVSTGLVKQPKPDLMVAMDTNLGVCILRSGKPERAAATFERALETIQNRLRPQSSLTLARCLFNAGEAKRQAGDLAAAREYLDEAASVMSAERTAVTEEDRATANQRRRSDLGALTLEVANSRGLCDLSASAQPFINLASSTFGTEAKRTTLGDVDDDQPRVEQNDGEYETRSSGEEEEDSAAVIAAVLISQGGKAEDGGAHVHQKTNNAVLEGIAWSLAGRSTTDGVAALKRAERLVGKVMADERAIHDTAAPALLTSAAMGESAPAGSDSDAQLAQIHLGVLCNQGVAARGGIGLGAAFSTGIAGAGPAAIAAAAASEEGVGKDAAAALAAANAARAATKAAKAGWREASELVKKQTRAAQVAVDSARQLSMAHAHAGAIELMTGKPAEAAVLFGHQLDEARKVGDALLEALAERNLADAREGAGDLPGALQHLRRCRDLVRARRNAALEADTCRRLSSIYASIAGPAATDLTGPGSEMKRSAPDEGSGGSGQGGADYDGMTEAEIEAKEEEDVAFLRTTASRRANLFAERYEYLVSHLAWPVGGAT